jgi:hypothetical protein
LLGVSFGYRNFSFQLEAQLEYKSSVLASNRRS